MQSLFTATPRTRSNPRARLLTRLAGVASVAALLLTSAPQAHAQFSVFTPLGASVVGGTLPEATPLLLSSPLFTQRTASANDAGPLNGNVKIGGNWDQNTFNETGPSAGRYIFTPYELGAAGVKRFDTVTGQTVELVAPGTQGFNSGDASRWTPWGTYLTGEETTNGRLFEITNPLAAPGSINFVDRSIIPGIAQEGLAFDKFNNLYMVDENVQGGIFKYTSTTPTNGATFFDKGQTFVLRSGDGSYEATGAGTWIPLTDVNGVPLPGVPTVVVNGVTRVNGRAANAFVGGTRMNRPEDLEIQTNFDGTQRIYFGTTDSQKVFSLNVSNPTAPSLNTFFNQLTIDAATGLPVGAAFTEPDNIAIDSQGNIYVVEDNGNISNGGTGFDIWFAYDDNRDGVAEKIGRWASLSTNGSEPTGFYFDPFNANVAYLNVQHTASNVDRLIQISTVPEPGTNALAVFGLVAIGVAARKRSRRATV